MRRKKKKHKKGKHIMEQTNIKLPVDVEVKTEKPKPKKTNHYVDNDKLLAEIIDYRNKVLEFKKNPKDKTKPKVSDYIGTVILQIAQRLSTRPNFASYTYKEEMIGDAIENCLMYIDNFDPEKSKNPFAYFTQIIYFAFLRRILKEKKQTYVKMKVFQDTDKKGFFKDWVINTNGEFNANSDNVYADYFKLSENDIKFFDGKMKKPIAKKKKNVKFKNKNSMENYLK